MRMIDLDNECYVNITEAQKDIVLGVGIANEEDGDVDCYGDLVLEEDKYQAAKEALGL